MGFDPEGVYELGNGETHETRTVSGREINEKGLAFTQPKASGSIWFYCKKQG